MRRPHPRRPHPPPLRAVVLQEVERARSTGWAATPPRASVGWPWPFQPGADWDAMVRLDQRVVELDDRMTAYMERGLVPTSFVLEFRRWAEAWRAWFRAHESAMTRFDPSTARQLEAFGTRLSRWDRELRAHLHGSSTAPPTPPVRPPSSAPTPPAATRPARRPSDLLLAGLGVTAVVAFAFFAGRGPSPRSPSD